MARPCTLDIPLSRELDMLTDSLRPAKLSTHLACIFAHFTHQLSWKPTPVPATFVFVSGQADNSC